MTKLNSMGHIKVTGYVAQRNATCLKRNKKKINCKKMTMIENETLSLKLSLFLLSNGDILTCL